MEEEYCRNTQLTQQQEENNKEYTKQIGKKKYKMVGLNPVILTTTWKVRRQNIALEERGCQILVGKIQDPTQVNPMWEGRCVP